ncbi:hypothetical protein RCL1_008460 [Eukaryota sp. TZLM3-RCL]
MIDPPPSPNLFTSTKYSNPLSLSSSLKFRGSQSPNSSSTLDYFSKSRVSKFWRKNRTSSYFSNEDDHNITDDDRLRFIQNHARPESVTSILQDSSLFSTSSLQTSLHNLDLVLRDIIQKHSQTTAEFDEISQRNKNLYQAALLEEQSRLIKTCTDREPLSEFEEDVYVFALANGRPGLQFNLEITANDLSTLKPRNWLNDEIINFYFQLIMDRSKRSSKLPKIHVMSTFFYPKISKKYSYSAVQRWTKKVNIFQCDKVLIPIHLGNHWTLCVINFQSNLIEYYDSMGGHGESTVNYVKRWLIDEGKSRHQPINIENFDTFSPGPKCPNQSNCDDCGVFACIFAECSARNEVPPFTNSVNSKFMKFFRKRMVLEIFVGCLRGDTSYNELLDKVKERFEREEDEESVVESGSDSDLEVLSG